MKQNPFAYLLGVARLAMIACISGRDDLIKTHHHQQSVAVLSLDKPLASSDGADGDATLADVLAETQGECVPQEPAPDYDPLYQAIAALPDRLRIVIEQHYGFGCAPQSLNAMSASLAKAAAAQQEAPASASRKQSIHKRPSVAHARKRQAIALMQHLLAASVYVRGEGVCIRAEVQR